MPPDAWTLTALERELSRYRTELERAGLERATIDTYTDHPARFLRWLAGGYHPRTKVGRESG